MSKLTHFNRQGEAHMVDVGTKAETHRIAVATGRIYMQTDTLALIETGNHKKGDVMGIARTAGIMAAKNTSSLIPLCHPIPITKIEIMLETIQPKADQTACVECQAQVETIAKTGVEVEALTAVHIALLTIYDMCKSTDRGMVMTEIALLQKSGGRSGEWKRAPTTLPH